MTQPVETVAAEVVRDAALVSTEIKKIAVKLSKVDTKAAESEKEVAKCNDVMRSMMDGETPQTGTNNIAVVAKEQQKHVKKAEKIRENAIEDAKVLMELEAELSEMVAGLIAPYKSKFVDTTEAVLEEDADGFEKEAETEDAE